MFGGGGVAAFLGLLTLGFNARALGMEGIGTLALVTTTAAMVTKVFGFQSWVPLIKLGAEALRADDKQRVADLARIGLMLDFSASMVGMTFAVLLVLLAGREVGIAAHSIFPAAIYMISVITAVTDTASGLLRLLNRFGVVTAVQVASSTLGCFYAALLFVAQADLTAYILGYATIAASTNIALQIAAFRIARKAGIRVRFCGLRAAMSAIDRQFWSLSWTTSLSGTIYVMRESAPILVIGSIIGPGAVGLYHVANRIAGIVSIVMWAMNQSLYAEAAHLAAAKRYMDLTWLVVQTATYLGTFGGVVFLAVVATGPLMLRAAAGGAYSGAYVALSILVGAQALSAAGVGLRAALPLTAGPTKLLTANLTAISGFAIALTIATRALGISGAAAAQLVFELIALTIAMSQYIRWYTNQANVDRASLNTPNI